MRRPWWGLHMGETYLACIPRQSLALGCATAKTELWSWCRHLSSVRRQSVKPVFLDTAKRIKAKFWGKVPITHISRPHFCFSKFKFFLLLIYIFFSFFFLLKWDHIGWKKWNISPESTEQIRSKHYAYSLGMSPINLRNGSHRATQTKIWGSTTSRLRDTRLSKS